MEGDEGGKDDPFAHRVDQRVGRPLPMPQKKIDCDDGKGADGPHGPSRPICSLSHYMC